MARQLTAKDKAFLEEKMRLQAQIRKLKEEIYDLKGEVKSRDNEIVQLRQLCADYETISAMSPEELNKLKETTKRLEGYFGLFKAIGQF